MTKTQLQKLASQCVDDVMGRITSADVGLDYALVVTMVIHRLEEARARVEVKRG